MKYITLKCRDCGYEKTYAAEYADGKKCPNCGSNLYLPTETITDDKNKGG